MAPFPSFTVAGNWVERRKKNLLAKISKHFGEGGRAISSLVTMGTFLHHLQEGEKFFLARAAQLQGPTCPEVCIPAQEAMETSEHSEVSPQLPWYMVCLVPAFCPREGQPSGSHSGLALAQDSSYVPRLNPGLTASCSSPPCLPCPPPTPPML